MQFEDIAVKEDLLFLRIVYLFFLELYGTIAVFVVPAPLVDALAPV